ncbi:MAG: hypothetical protein ACHQRK_03535 [Gemmatimonadales bacterium]
MHRCIVLHRNASSELQDVVPALHQKLRHLDYKRFVVEFVRDPDGVSSTAPLYCQFTPSPWQTLNAAKQLWGRRTGTVRMFDEDGHLVQDTAAAGGTPLHGTPIVPAPPQPVAPTEPAPPPITAEDVELVEALARFVEQATRSDATFGVATRETVAERVRALGRKLAARIDAGA